MHVVIPGKQLKTIPYLTIEFISEMILSSPAAVQMKDKAEGNLTVTDFK